MKPKTPSVQSIKPDRKTFKDCFSLSQRQARLYNETR